jgi:succinylglutamic semialdehyde dehydrogenase
MHRQLDEKAPVVERSDVANILVSTDPATGEEIWSGELGDPNFEVEAARASWPAWAAHSVAYRIEAVRRFANVVRKRENEFAELIAKETGKPFWEARTEVAAVVNKVEISIEAYAERTPQRKLEAALGNRIAVRHKPHGVLAVLGPYNFPAHLPNGHIVPALIAGNTVVFKPSEKTPRPANSWSIASTKRKSPRARSGCWSAGPRKGRRWPPSPESTACCSPARRAPEWRSTGSLPKCRTRSSRSSLAATARWSCGRPRTFPRRR